MKPTIVSIHKDGNLDIYAKILNERGEKRYVPIVAGEVQMDCRSKTVTAVLETRKQLLAERDAQLVQS